MVGVIKQKGFTLIELLVVVAIIGILAAVGVVAYNGYTNAAKINAAKANHKTAVKFLHTTFLQANINGGYFNNRLSIKDFNCGRSQNIKTFPASVSTVMNNMVYHLRCVIKDHPFNDPTYPAINFGPRGIKGSVEFYNRCTNSKPIIHIETVYNDNKDKLTDQIDISEYGGYC